MQAWDLTKVFLKMFILQGKPAEVPDSKALLLFMSIVLVLTKTAVYLWFMHIINRFEVADKVTLSVYGAALVSCTWVFVMFATLRTTLVYYNLANRFVQAAISFLAMDCLLTVLFLAWLAGLALIEVPLQSYSVASIGVILGFVLMMYWQFMVYIHLLVYVMNISLLKAGIFTLFYMLLQHNLSEVLLNVVIIVTAK